MMTTICTVAAFEGAPEEIDVTVFPADGEAAKSAERGAKALVAEAHQARQFTDIASFTLRCRMAQREQGLGVLSVVPCSQADPIVSRHACCLSSATAEALEVDCCTTTVMHLHVC